MKETADLAWTDNVKTDEKRTRLQTDQITWLLLEQESLTRQSTQHVEYSVPLPVQ